MNKLNFVIVGILVVFCLSGCAKVEKTETISVQAKIVNTYHSEMWLQPVRSGNVTTWITHPEVNEITIKYEDTESTIDDYELYKKYKDKIGSIIECDLVIKHYDDGTIRKQLIPRRGNEK